MNRLFLCFALALISLTGFSQTGSVNATAFKSRVLDSTTVTVPTGYGVIYYNTQTNKWRFNENGTWYYFGSGSGGGGGSGTVTNVSGTSPISVVNGATTPTISISQSNGSTNGYLSSTDWTTFNNKLSTISGISAGGDLSGTYANPTVVKINGTSLAGLATGLIKNTTSTGIPSIATSGVDYELPLTFSTGLTRSTNTITVNTSQNISTLSNLTSNGLIKTSGGTGALSIATAGTDYLTGNQTITLSGDVSGSGATAITTTIGAGKVTNSMLAGSISDGNLATSYIKADGTRAFTGDQSLGGFKITNVKELDIAGTAGAGFINFVAQNVNPTAPAATGFNLFASSTGNLRWAKKNGTDTYVRGLIGTISADRDYTLPDWSGNVLVDGGNNVLGASTTITSNTMGWLNFASTATATANNQITRSFTSVVTSRSTANDLITDEYQNTTFNLGSTNIDANARIIDVTYNGSGGISTGTPAIGNQVNSSPSGMTAGNYTNIAPSSTSGSGSGALFSLTGVTTTSLPVSVSCTTTGSGYRIGDTVTFNGSIFQGTLNGGGSGSGTGSVTYTIFSIGSQTVASKASVLRLINRTPDVQGIVKQYLTFANASATVFGSIGQTMNSSNQPVLSIYDRLGLAFSSDGSIINFGRTISSITANAGTIAGLSTNGITSAAGGQTYSTGGFTNSILARTGTTIFSANGVFHSIVGTPNTTLTGLLSTAGLGAITGGSGYTNGTYNGVALTGGSGTGATANITVSGGAVTAVTIVAAGNLYTPGNSLSAAAANIGGTGSGFSVAVTDTDFTGGIYAIVSDNRTLNDKGSSTSYYGFYGNPTLNITSSRVGDVTGFYWNPSLTSIGSFNRYGIRIVSAIDLSGFGTATPAATVDIRGTGSTNPALRIASGGTSTEYALRIQQSDVTTDIFTIQGNGNGFLKGVMQWGTNSTGSGSAALGSNSPATTLTAPYTWIQMKSSDGSTVYVPAWK